MLAAAMLFAALGAQDHVFPGGEDGAAPAAASRPLTARQRCVRGEDEITVCAEDQAGFRASPMANPYAEKPIRARAALPGGGTADATAVQRGVAPGVSVPSMMFNLRLPFGKGKKKRAAER